MVKFSIIVAFYRGNKYVNNLVKMACANAKEIKKYYDDFRVELLIVNDSPDEQVVLPHSFSGIDVRIINHKINRGIHQARITGLNECIGDYVLILDQDDEINDDFLYNQYNKIGKGDVCVCNAIIEKNLIDTILLYPNRKKFSYVLKINPFIKSHNQIISPGQCLIKKESIPNEWKNIVINNNGSDDLFLWILMHSQNKRFILNEQNLYKHKYTGINLSADKEKMINSTLEIAKYLETIPYVSASNVNSLVRARTFKTRLKDAKALNKLLLCVEYIDIVVPCAVWKITFFSYKYKMNI